MAIQENIKRQIIGQTKHQVNSKVPADIPAEVLDKWKNETKTTPEAPAFDTSVFEPVAEEVELPSKGKFYKEKNTSLFKNGGKILIRPMTMQEELILQNPRVIKTGKIIDALLRQTIKTPDIDLNFLLTTDRIFLFYYLRSISYGDSYKFNFECPYCENHEEVEIFLGQLKIKNPDEKAKEPFLIYLGENKKIWLRYARGFDEDKYDLKDEKFQLKTILNLVVDIEGVPKQYWEKFLTSLTVKENAKLQKDIVDKTTGIDTDITHTCSACNTEHKISLPITANFFRISQ